MQFLVLTEGACSDAPGYMPLRALRCAVADKGPKQEPAISHGEIE